MTTSTVTQEMITVYGGSVLVDDLGYPVATGTGPRCGNHYGDHKIHHNSVGAVRYCYAITAEQDAQAADEQAMERRTERFYEEGF